MISQETLNFLKKLDKNNNREWFTAHKADFQNAKDNVTAFAGHLISEIEKFDPAVAGLMPDACVFRIYRDVRFSKNKSPYKTNLGMYLSPGGRKSMAPGYYLHIQPGNSFVAGGKHLPDSSETLKIRNAIATDTAVFRKIVEKRSFLEQFGEMRGERLRSAPKGFDASHPAIEYLKLKEFMAFKELNDDSIVLSPDFPRALVKAMKDMCPLAEFLRAALAK
jgi:uncharacterized protein (TIGR02453 family)